MLVIPDVETEVVRAATSKTGLQLRQDENDIAPTSIGGISKMDDASNEFTLDGLQKASHGLRRHSTRGADLAD